VTRTTPTVIRVDDTAGDATAFAAIIESGKPGITRMVTITAGVGYLLAALGRGGWNLGELLATAFGAIAGTALASAGANVLNMWYEAESDARMHRTKGRPIPTGRLSRNESAKAGILLSVAGVLITLIFAGTAAALLCLACVVSYVMVYTPLKPRTVLNTLVGTIPGALPPMIGAAAASGGIGVGAFASPVGWSIVGLMAVWQIPHFLAIAWVHREDYARGGQRMLPVIDPTGRVTSAVIVVTALLLIPASVAPVLAEPLLGPPSLVLASITGLAYLALCIRLAFRRTDRDAKVVFIASIVHLPLLLVTFVAEAALTVLVG
jgi:protoheme IX farnesyltransferase